jgi:ATP-binding cassette subfamily F protein 3
LHSKDVLLQALKDFGGTVVFVSHDRGFIEQLATSVLELTPGKFKYFPGNYEYYMEQLLKAEQNAGDAVAVTKTSANANSASSSSETKTAAKLSWEEQKKAEAERRKKEKAVAKMEEEIQKLEEKKAELEAKLADPAVYSNGEKAKAVQTEIQKIAAELDAKTEEYFEMIQ